MPPPRSSQSGIRVRTDAGRPPPLPRLIFPNLHAEWVGMLRPDGPFIAVPQLTEAFPHAYLDVIEDIAP